MDNTPNSGKISALSLSPTHTMSKFNQKEITLIKGIGISWDAHAGKTVKHRSRVAKNPKQPNLRQVHLMHHELYQELNKKGFDLSPGEMGENITTTGIDLLNLPKNTQLKIGNAIIEITGLRNPCSQLNDLRPGLMNELVFKDQENEIIRKAGIMGIVVEGGIINLENIIEVILPPKPFLKLEKV